MASDTPRHWHQLGQLVATPGVLAWLEDDIDSRAAQLAELLRRHADGDDGDIDAEDHALNTAAWEVGYRVLSAYQCGDTRVWIVTESDRSSTTVLLPEEY